MFIALLHVCLKVYNITAQILSVRVSYTAGCINIDSLVGKDLKGFLAQSLTQIWDLKT